MRNLVAIDPGLNGSGLAVFDIAHRKLLSADYARNSVSRGGRLSDRVRGMARAIRECILVLRPEELVLVTEQMQIYRTSKDPNRSLVPNLQICANLAGMLDGSQWLTYLPREWKGTLDPDAFIERIKGRLDRIETEQVADVGALTHNVWDAVGLGLKYLGRLERIRVVPR